MCFVFFLFFFYFHLIIIIPYNKLLLALLGYDTQRHMRPPAYPAWEDLRTPADERARLRTAHTDAQHHVSRLLAAAGVTKLKPRPAAARKSVDTAHQKTHGFYEWRTQETLDYADVLEACSVSRARYTIVIEEDAFSTPAFFKNVTHAIRSAERHEVRNGGGGGGVGKQQWWIKLFVTDFWSDWSYTEDGPMFPVCKYD